ncbi:NYN domain-containing protein [Intrasporangium calvum]|uniref:NYN domain-containing protein n=1 Tax=Intrasporangium calvum TaxID=53358 RepID=A0ABT5GLQ6_9MICO|nr:NYN domain-containing protein [Intrasporangium calvum]MDC5698966.1 NYN domain-containing protein [Intrasporangium calvum]
MRSHCALYVDAGYLLAAAATRVTGTSLRGSVVISYPDLVSRLVEQAEALSGLPLLRVNWYDSGNRPGGAPDATQDSIGMLPRVKLRLGRTSPHGEQKGVDLRIGLDLAAHGRNHVVDTMYLVSGDDDLSEAVEEAQSHGAQVVILAVPDSKGRAHAVSNHLIRESDGLELVDPETIDDTIRPRQLQAETSASLSPEAAGVVVPLPGPRSAPRPEASAPDAPAAASAHAATQADSHPDRPTPAILAHSRPQPATGAGGAGGPAAGGSKVAWSSSSEHPALRPHTLSPAMLEMIDDVCRGVVSAWRATATKEDRRRVMSERPFIPSDLDRTLLTDLSARLDVYDIPDEIRYRLREQFWDAVDELGR